MKRSKALPFSSIFGLPFWSLIIPISFHLIPFARPVPNAFEQASFAAYLFAYEAYLFALDSDFIISVLVKHLSINLLPNL